MKHSFLCIKYPAHALLIALLVVNCGVTSGCDDSPECRAFRDMSFTERAGKIRTSPVEQQLDLYKCGMYTHPPDDYAGEIADGGEKNISAVLGRLKSEESETHQDDLIHIFEEMAKKGHLRGRQDVAAQVSVVISKMKLDEIKARAQPRLNIIKANV